MLDPSGIRSLIEQIALGVVGEHVTTGIVDAVESHDSFGYLLTCTLAADPDREVQARPLWLGTGEGAGLWWPIRTGSEVLLVFPRGDVNAAIALVGQPAAMSSRSPRR